MAARQFSGAAGSVTTHAITGHQTGVTIPSAQRSGASARIGDASTSQGRVLANAQPNTDRRRFVTHN